MKILVLDVYKDVDHRISKDTSGGYGTGNNFGDTLIPSFLKKSLKKIHDWSPMFVAYTISVLKKNGNQVFFSKKLPNNFENYDLYIVASSIVCCETEIDVIKKIKSKGGRVFTIGPFATNQPKIYNNAGATVILGEPEFYFLQKKEYEDDLKKKKFHLIIHMSWMIYLTQTGKQ